MPPPAHRSPSQRRLILWLLAWLLLTTLGAGATIAAWSPGFLSPAAADSIKPAANLLQFLATPGWILVRLITPVWHMNSAGANLVAHGAAWACGLAGAALVLAVRRRVLAAAPAPIESRPAFVPSRRRFLVDAPLAMGGLVGSAGLARASLIDPWDLVIRRYSVPISDLPNGLDGLRIVQLSDTHLGPRVPAAFIERAVAKALALGPDLVLLTGDYIHSGRRCVGQAAALFAPIVRAGVPTVGVLGNHDWYGAGHVMSAALRAVGVQMIDNTRVYLDESRRLTGSPRPGGALCLAGVGDLTEDRVDLDAALRGVSHEVPRLLLAHNPDTAEVPAITRARPRIDLMLSGHTHGGQVRLPFVGAPMVPSGYGQKYEGGLVLGPACRVLISRGIGMSILPIRFNVPPEIVELTLTTG